MTAPSRAAGATFLGHPIGLAYLSFAEAWERFSYYGMQTLLVLYMTKQLLLAPHVDRILGFGPFRAFLESAGPMTPVALASAIFGLYAACVYLTPILGGLLADRVLGRTRTVTLGALLMATGHFLMAFDVSFLIALTCLLLGVGCFKGNIATQVGELYAPDDLRRANAFQIYMFGIQIAVIISPLVCGTLGQKVGWHWGFGAAGVGMVIGLIVYLSARRHLPPEPPLRRKAEAGAPKAPFTPRDVRAMIVLVALLPVLAMAVVGNQQIGNAYLLWGDAHYQLEFFGKTMPVSWLMSLDAFVSAITMAGSLVFWRWWATRRTEPNEITKLTIGVVIAALAPLVLALASLQASGGHKVGLVWGVAFHVINDIGFANIFPVGLALYTRAAPKSLGGTILAIYYLHLFAGNLLVGWLGGLLDKLPGSTFWMIHVGLIGAAAVLLLLARAVAGAALAPEAAPEPEGALATA
ncbi:MAG: peptide MFS transporter [Proteobacteria bacterium]|nr:peptide MFS transporter [Pseudomonadota bacterium]